MKTRRTTQSGEGTFSKSGLKTRVILILNFTRPHAITYTNNIHEKISPCWLAESMSINPKQCKNLKFFESRKTKLVQKVEIECKNLKLSAKTSKLNWLTGKSRKRNSQMANQIFCFQNQDHALDGAIHCVIFTSLRDTQAFPLLNHLEIFSSISMENFFHVYY